MPGTKVFYRIWLIEIIFHTRENILSHSISRLASLYLHTGSHQHQHIWQPLGAPHESTHLGSSLWATESRTELHSKQFHTQTESEAFSPQHHTRASLALFVNTSCALPSSILRRQVRNSFGKCNICCFLMKIFENKHNFSLHCFVKNIGKQINHLKNKPFKTC